MTPAHCAPEAMSGHAGLQSAPPANTKSLSVLS
eukprot:COSAG05_NODE_25083_length_198_cov_46.020202_1_plen_32_part_10